MFVGMTGRLLTDGGGGESRGFVHHYSTLRTVQTYPTPVGNAEHGSLLQDGRGRRVPGDTSGKVHGMG